jgi:hypothetical protein
MNEIEVHKSKFTAEDFEMAMVKGEEVFAEIESIIDESGVLDDTSGTVTEKVEQLVDKASDEFIGVKYSNFSENDNLPKTADARSFDKILPNGQSFASNNVLLSKFANTNANINGGYHAKLEEVYLPSKATALSSTFSCCTKLTTIHGDLSNINYLNVAFSHCISLDVNAVLKRMTNLADIGSSSFKNCTQITEITLPATITSMHNAAFGGCTNITTVNISDGWNCSLYLNYSDKLTQESLHAMIENLADLSETTAKYFKVGSTNIAKIDEEHITMLNNKNWNYS